MKGLKVGFEFHQQLDTEEKLFCACPPELEEGAPDYSILRKLHPTESELGEVDRAALEEARRGRLFRYLGYDDVTCLVENDDEPPKRLDREALEIALQISLMLDSRPVDRVEVMRKVVIDGSNTAGFQRTSLVALGGRVDTDEGPVAIETVCLEEEAAQKREELDGRTVYSLDRLGIPLVEVGCAPDVNSPEQAAEFAEKVGTIFRSTGSVKRGIGTIRQDVNISVEGGARVELKGVQELDMVGTYVEREAERQKRLLEISQELEARGVTGVDLGAVDVTGLFEDTESDILKSAIESGDRIVAGVLEGAEGLLGKEVQPNRRFGTELSDRAKVTGVGGILHTDELPGHGITRNEVEALRKKVGAEGGDAVVLVAGEEGDAEEALGRVGERFEEALKGVPVETRRPLPDGDSEYMRPLPGAARMYPETDVPPVELGDRYVEGLREDLPEMIPERVSRFVEEYGLSEDLASQMARSRLADFFEEAVQGTGIDPVLAIRTLLHYPKEAGVDVSPERLVEVLGAVAELDLAREAVPEIVEELGEREGSVEEVVEDLGLSQLGEERVRQVVRDVIRERSEFVKERGMSSVGALMGPVMEQIRGRAEGSRVNEILRAELEAYLEDEE